MSRIQKKRGTNLRGIMCPLNGVPVKVRFEPRDRWCVSRLLLALLLVVLTRLGNCMHTGSTYVTPNPTFENGLEAFEIVRDYLSKLFTLHLAQNIIFCNMHFFIKRYLDSLRNYVRSDCPQMLPQEGKIPPRTYVYM